MGDRLSGEGVTGRRREHPGDAVPGSWDLRDDAALQTALAAAVLASDLDPEAEQRAVAAFRAARGAGAHRARTRRRDDWRLLAERRAGRRVKTTFAAVFTSLALGGVAVAAIGSAGSSADGTGQKTPHPSVAAPARPGGEISPTSSGGPGPSDGSSSAQDTEAQCRAYEQVKDRGKTLDATAWQRLVAAAGGESKVAAYCAEQLARATATPSRSVDRGKSSAGAADAGTGTAGNTGTSGNTGRSGNGIPATTPAAPTMRPATAGQAAGPTGNLCAHRPSRSTFGGVTVSFVLRGTRVMGRAHCSGSGLGPGKNIAAEIGHARLSSLFKRSHP